MYKILHIPSAKTIGVSVFSRKQAWFTSEPFAEYWLKCFTYFYVDSDFIYLHDDNKIKHASNTIHDHLHEFEIVGVDDV